MPAQLTQRIISDPRTGKSIIIYGDSVERYNLQIAEFEDSKCQHLKTELRRKILSNGSPRLKLQCTTCGKPIGQAVKQNETNLAALPWDVLLNEDFYAKRARTRDSIQIKFADEARDKSKKNKKSAIEWQAEYQAYRRTPDWQKKRYQVFKRGNGLCEGCAEAPSVVVHHLSYVNMGDELLFDLVGLCKPCHKKAHPEHSEPEFYDNDYVACVGCRWGGDAVDCHKFQVRCYQALAPDGDCGPTVAAFEGLK